jgi:hypothetical protein
MEATREKAEIQTTTQALQVVDQESYNFADQIAARCARAIKKIETDCAPAIEAAHKAHKAALAQRDNWIAPIKTLKADIDAKMKTWWRKEQERLEQIRRYEEEKARREAEERALEEAQALEDMGFTDAADEILAAPVVTPTIHIQEPQKGAGVSYRENWKAEVVDINALIKAIAAGLAPAAYLMPNESALNAAAKAFKGTVQIPGVVFKTELIQARRIA